MNYGLFLFIFSSTMVFSTAPALGITLDEYLNRVKQKNRLYSSTELSLQASSDRQQAGDLELSPNLTAGYTLSSDKTLPNSVASERKFSDYNLGVAKKFSTGTTVNLTAKYSHFENEEPLNNSTPDYSTSGLGISFQQSLWKDFFGAATKLRKERESLVNSTETWSIELKRRTILFEAESSFWDFVVASEDVKLKQENLERARKLDRWTTGRVNNGISDRSDLMNVKALMALRELQLQTALDQLKSEEVRFRKNLDLAEGDAIPEVQASWTEPRPYIGSLLNENKNNKSSIVQIEAHVAVLEAKARKAALNELTDSLKPDLSLLGGYNTSGYDSAGAGALKDVAKTERPRQFVGLSFSWLFDTEAKKAQVAATQKEALVAQYTAEKKASDGKADWTEHLRSYKTANESVKTLEKIALYQKERVKAEQDKFSKGRTITTNVVSAETDSAEADVNYLKAKSGLRKLEAATLFYITTQE